MISKKEEESVLEVAVRWSHLQIVRYLLHTVEWDKEALGRAFVHVQEDHDNPLIRNMLLSYSRNKFGRAYTCLSLSSFCRCLFPTYSPANQVVPYHA